MSSNKFYVVHWMEGHQHWYRMRADVLSVEYKEFCGWINQQELEFSSDDMPWEYFVFKHEAARLEFVERMAGCLSDDPEEHWSKEPRAQPAPIDENSIEYQMAMILQEEIQKELNRELIKRIS